MGETVNLRGALISYELFYNVYINMKACNDIRRIRSYKGNRMKRSEHEDSEYIALLTCIWLFRTN